MVTPARLLFSIYSYIINCRRLSGVFSNQFSVCEVLGIPAVAGASSGELILVSAKAMAIPVAPRVASYFISQKKPNI